MDSQRKTKASPTKFSLPRELTKPSSDGASVSQRTRGSAAPSERLSTAASRVMVPRAEYERLLEENARLKAQADRYMLPKGSEGTVPSTFFKKSASSSPHTARGEKQQHFPHNSVLEKEFYEKNGVQDLLRPDAPATHR